MRRYDKGQIVGTIDVPMPFEDWLKAELDRAHDLDKRLPKPVTLNSLATVAGAQARMRALEEVSAAWERAKGMRATEDFVGHDGKLHCGTCGHSHCRC